VSIIERLPVPRPAVDSFEFRNIVELSARLGMNPSDSISAPELQASVARLYGLTSPEFQRVLETFPLIGETERSAARRCFLARAGG
jgi:hypothetical protein